MSWKSVTTWVSSLWPFSWCFQIPSLVQFRNDFCGESSKGKPRFLICGNDISRGTFPSSTRSNSVVCKFHALSYMWITNFSVRLVCWEFAKQNLELVSSILYHSPQSCLSTSSQNAFTAFLEPIALVHPRRIATVGGIWFSVWKATATLSHHLVLLDWSWGPWPFFPTFPWKYPYSS